MNAPRTSREALVAEVLGDLDALLERVEALPAAVADAASGVTNTVRALEAAGDQYRTAVAAFNEQAKADLNEFLDLKAMQVSNAANQTVAEQGAAIRAAARTAFHAQEFQRSTRRRMAEQLLTALLTSTLTAMLVVAWLRHHW